MEDDEVSGVPMNMPMGQAPQGIFQQPPQKKKKKFFPKLELCVFVSRVTSRFRGPKNLEGGTSRWKSENFIHALTG